MMADRGAESGRVRESQTRSAVALYTSRSAPRMLRALVVIHARRR